MAKCKVMSLLCWIGIGGILCTVQMNYLPELVAAPAISFLVAGGFLSAAWASMAEAKEEEEEEREETFIGY